MSAAAETADLFPIRVVSQRTGVHTVTLRAWERRYGLLRPVRTAKGHRLYGQRDIARVLAIVSWLERGVAISQVGGLLARSGLPAGLPAAAGDDAWSALRLQVRDAAAAYDGRRLDELLAGAMSLYPLATLADHLLLPLATTEAALPGCAPGARAAQAFLSASLNRQLDARLQQGVRHAEGAPVLLAPLDEVAARGLPLRVLALALQAGELAVLSPGQPLPPVELLVMCGRRPPRVVVLFGEQAQDVHGLQRMLARLVQGAGCPVVLAGGVAHIHETLARACHCVALAGHSPAQVAKSVTELAGGRPA